MTRLTKIAWLGTLGVVATLAIGTGCDNDSKTPTVDAGSDASPDGTVGGGTLATGTACTADSECTGTNPDCITGLYPLKDLPGIDPVSSGGIGLDMPGGYCSTVAPCASDSECGTDGKCFQPLADVMQADIDSLAPALGGGAAGQANAEYFHHYGACLLPCTWNRDCRIGYVCDVPIGDFLALVPGTRAEKYCVGPSTTTPSCGTCDANATCDMTGASPVCVCNTGYTGDGNTCTPM